LENRNIIYYEELDSTNIMLETLAKDGAKEGTIVVADKQLAGKGRRGRQWESPKGENIYMSILLRPVFDASLASMLTIVAAYSVALVIREIGFQEAKIKWPNDIVLSGKKVCGILTELHLKGTEIDYVIVGIGVNVNTKCFSSELSDKATSLYLEGEKPQNREMILHGIIGKFEEQYTRFLQCQDLSFMKEEYDKMLANRNQEVCVLEPGKEYRAYAKGITNTGELVVTTADGCEKKVYAGEVSVRGIYGYV
jgi:BirA family biotin operon repressor/biotin-[acetyl-CoA-carboxylase] ligase